jgi:hypothetical protein
MEQSLFTPEEFRKLKPVKGGKRQKREEKEQLKVCDYLGNNYPGVIWFCDLASGLYLPPWIAAMNKKMRSSRALPDIFIAHPKAGKKTLSGKDLVISRPYNGLFIEQKKDGIRRKDGSIPPAWKTEIIGGVKIKYDHHAEQEEILKRLRIQGYKAEFCCGYTEAIKLIDDYLT